jgi:hypothetical protein
MPTSAALRPPNPGSAPSATVAGSPVAVAAVGQLGAACTELFAGARCGRDVVAPGQAAATVVVRCVVVPTGR